MRWVLAVTVPVYRPLVVFTTQPGLVCLKNQFRESISAERAYTVY